MLPMLALLCATVFIVVKPSIVYAVPANPWSEAFTQPDGTVITVQMMGDEYLNWTEDGQGNHIIFDGTLNAYCYARWTEDGSISTGAAVGSAGDDQTYIEKGSAIPGSMTQEAEQTQLLFGAAQTTAEPEPAPSISSPESLQRKMLAIYVRWEDESNIQQPPLSASVINNLLFNPSSNSVNKYYRELFDSPIDIVTPAQVSGAMDGYQGIIEVLLPGKHRDSGSTLNDGRWRSIMNEVIHASDPYINFSQFDTNGDGNLARSELAICIIVQGYEASSNPTLRPSIWSAALSGGTVATLDGVRIQGLFAQGAYHDKSDDATLTVGVICHEFGHSGYDFMDVYDTTYKSNGLGYWSLMSYGSWCHKAGEKSGSTPAYVDAYNLTFKGLIRPNIFSNESAAVTLQTVRDIYRINTSDPKQYFLVQQRKYGVEPNYDMGTFYKISGSANTNTGGLLIYQVDENVTDGNRNSPHYLVSIEEAHGQTQGLRLPITEGDKGNLGDLWGSGYTLFDSSTDPGSLIYSQGVKSVESGVRISGIRWDGFTLEQITTTTSSSTSQPTTTSTTSSPTTQATTTSTTTSTSTTTTSSSTSQPTTSTGTTYRPITNSTSTTLLTNTSSSSTTQQTTTTAAVKTFSIRVSVSNYGSGTVSGGGNYFLNDTATLLAEAKAGYRFVGWYEQGRWLSDAPEIQILVTSDRMIAANFVADLASTNNYRPLVRNPVSIEAEPIIQTIALPVAPVPNAAPMNLLVTQSPVLDKSGTVAYLSAITDGSVYPEQQLTRYEAINLFYALVVNDDKDAYASVSKQFIDTLEDTNSHALGYMAAKGIVVGFPDGTFRGDATITRAEFLTIASKFVETNTQMSLPFADVTESHWAYSSLQTAYNNAWIVGYPNGALKPDQKVSLAESIVVINRMLGRSSANITSNTESYVNLSQRSWYFDDIMLAF